MKSVHLLNNVCHVIVAISLYKIQIVHLLLCRNDPVVPLEFGADLAAMIPQARFLEHSGGHGLSLCRHSSSLISAAIVDHCTSAVSGPPGVS